MLEIWLDTDCNATWDKIYKAIECPGVTQVNSNFQQDDGMHAYVYLRNYSWYVHIPGLKLSKINPRAVEKVGLVELEPHHFCWFKINIRTYVYCNKIVIICVNILVLV